MMNKKFSWKNDHWIKPYLAQYKWNFLLAIFLGVITVSYTHLIGATTRFYFLPNATIREFAGVFIMHKKRHFVIIGLIAILFIIQAIFALLGWSKYIIA